MNCQFEGNQSVPVHLFVLPFLLQHPFRVVEAVVEVVEGVLEVADLAGAHREVRQVAMGVARGLED